MASITSRALTPELSTPVLARVPYRKVIAAAVWLGGLGTTLAFVLHYLPVMVSAVVLSLVLQAALTLCEHPLWAPRRVYDDDGAMIVDDKNHPLKGPVGWFPFAALVLDVLPNTWGAWFLIRDIHHTPLAQMVNEMQLFRHPMRPLVGWPALGLCVCLGVLLAIVPEQLWSSGD